MRNHIQLILADSEREKLDRLIGAAMLDYATCRRLIGERDTALFEEYELSPISRELIIRAQASSLPELAAAIASFKKRCKPSGTIRLRSTTIE